MRETAINCMKRHSLARGEGFESDLVVFLKMPVVMVTVMCKSMANSLQGVREARAFAYTDSIIDDAVFAILHEENLSRGVFPY